jgi:hypothetical protein
LYGYGLPAETFRCIDECAGDFVSRVPVVPTSVDVIDDPIGELRRREVQLRIMPTLWPLRDAVVASSLQFSIIRLRNAQPREAIEHGPAAAFGYTRKKEVNGQVSAHHTAE